MRYFISGCMITISFGILLGLAQIGNKYKDENMIDAEFKNIYLYMQPIQHKVFNSTPVLKNLQDKEIVIVSSLTFNTLMFRSNQEIYTMNGSCVTARR